MSNLRVPFNLVYFGEASGRPVVYVDDVPKIVAEYLRNLADTFEGDVARPDDLRAIANEVLAASAPSAPSRPALHVDTQGGAPQDPRPLREWTYGSDYNRAYEVAPGWVLWAASRREAEENFRLHFDGSTTITVETLLAENPQLVEVKPGDGAR